MGKKSRYISPIITKRVQNVLWKANPKCKALAITLQCSEQKAWMIMNSRTLISADDIRSICLEYNVSPLYLLGLENCEFEPFEELSLKKSDGLNISCAFCDYIAALESKEASETETQTQSEVIEDAR